MKKFVLPILVGLVIGGLASIAYIWWIRNNPVPTEQKIAPTLVTEQPRLLTWTDPNGFTFQYPDGLSVNKHDEDKEHYAQIEFTHPDHPGNVIVWGKDPIMGVSDTDSWVTKEKRFIGAAVLDTELDGKKAKKLMIEGVTRMAVTGAVVGGIVWTVEARLDDADFWMTVHDAMVRSFAFIPVKQGESEASAESVPAVSEDAADEEETIE